MRFAESKSKRLELFSAFMSRVDSLMLGLVFVFATVYILLNARNDWYADLFLLVIATLSFPRLIGSDFLGKRNVFALFLSGYLAMAIIGIFLQQSAYVNVSWLISASFRIFCVLILVSAVIKCRTFDLKVFSLLLPILCLGLGVSIILISHQFLDKQVLNCITPWPVIDTEGNHKYFSFYLLFLMWVVVAQLWGPSLQGKLLAGLVLAVTFAALYSSTSESSVLAWGGGVFVFFLFQQPWIKKRGWFCFLVIGTFFLLPLLWVAVAPVISMDQAGGGLQELKSFLQNHRNIGVRFFLFDSSAELIRKEFLFGYGFGSTLSMPIPSGVLPELSAFPGGHPHNLVFLILLELGVVGYSWLVFVCFSGVHALNKIILNKRKSPAIWALIVSAQIVFSLSFSVWHPDVVLVYGMFFVFLSIAVNLVGRSLENGNMLNDQPTIESFGSKV